MTEKPKINLVGVEVPGMMRVDGLMKQTRYVCAGNGYFRIDDTKFGQIVTSVKTIPDLPCYKAGVTLDVPKIPLSFLWQITEFFKSLNTEAYVQIFWDPVNKTYVQPFVPEQTVSGASVSYKRDIVMDKQYVEVCEIHSHVDMEAFFSSTDDNDEQRPLIYGVIGKLKSDGPKYSFRAKSGDSAIKMEIGDIFDMGQDAGFPKEWTERVKERSWTQQHDYHEHRWGGSNGRQHQFEYLDQARVNDSNWEETRRKSEETA